MYDLKFNPENYQIKRCELDGREVIYRAFENIVYCANPVSAVQKLNLYVPEVYYQGESINGYQLHTAPIFAPNTVGGYMEGPAMQVGEDYFGHKPNTAFEALYHGYVVMCAGIRGRNTGRKSNEFFVGGTNDEKSTKEGMLTGRAPALIVDMKAAIRYLRWNKDLVPGDVEKIITNGTSAGGALSALAGATGNAKEYEPYLKAIGAAKARDAPTADDSSKYATFFAAQGWSGAAKTTWGPNNGVENCTAVQYGDTVVSNTTVRGSINGIYSGCEHPDKALELLNLVNTDSKVRDWFYYGAEGVDFEYTEDNKVHRLSTDWKMAGYTQGTFFNVTQTDDVDFNQWDEVKELNENAKPSVMIGFNLDTSEIETELANCRAVYEKYYSELFTGAREPREMVETINEELEKAGWETIREEAQKQIDAQK